MNHVLQSSHCEQKMLFTLQQAASSSCPFSSQVTGTCESMGCCHLLPIYEIGQLHKWKQMEYISQFWREWKCLCRSGNSGRQKIFFVMLQDADRHMMYENSGQQTERICYRSWYTRNWNKEFVIYLLTNNRRSSFPHFWPSSLSLQQVILV